METFEIGNLFITFLAGILSVLSPCLLPILPGFIAYFAGLGLDEAKEKKHRKIVFFNSLFFSLGFTLTFLGFGLIAGGISLFLITNQLFLQQVGGVILIIFGIFQTGILKPKFIQKELRISPNTLNLPKNLYLRSVIVGMIFAFGWTPCYGPIIGGIFTLGASSQTVGSSLILFLVYSIGFTIPIILLSLTFDKLSSLIAKHKRLISYSHIVAGMLLILMGLLMITNSLSNIVNWLDIIYTQNNATFY